MSTGSLDCSALDTASSAVSSSVGIIETVYTSTLLVEAVELPPIQYILSSTTILPSPNLAVGIKALVFQVFI